MSCVFGILENLRAQAHSWSLCRKWFHCQLCWTQDALVGLAVRWPKWKRESGLCLRIREALGRVPSPQGHSSHSPRSIAFFLQCPCWHCMAAPSLSLFSAPHNISGKIFFLRGKCDRQIDQRLILTSWPKLSKMGKFKKNSNIKSILMKYAASPQVKFLPRSHSQKKIVQNKRLLFLSWVHSHHWKSPGENVQTGVPKLINGKSGPEADLRNGQGSPAGRQWAQQSRLQFRVPQGTAPGWAWHWLHPLPGHPCPKPRSEQDGIICFGWEGSWKARA